MVGGRIYKFDLQLRGGSLETNSSHSKMDRGAQPRVTALYESRRNTIWLKHLLFPKVRLKLPTIDKSSLWKTG